MIEIPLTRGYVTVIDDEDAHLAERKWHAVVTTTGHVYACGRKNGKRVKLHRVIMGAPDGLDVDHIDRDTLNNRRSNLRAITHAGNVRNSARSDDSGVRVCEKTGRWYARIRWDGVAVFLGRHDTEGQAKDAVRQAKLMLDNGVAPRFVSATFRHMNAKPSRAAPEDDYFNRFLAGVNATVAIQKSTKNA